MKNEQTVTFKNPGSHIEIMTFMSEPGKPFRIIMKAPFGDYFGTVFLSEAEMESVRDAIADCINLTRDGPD